MKPFGKRSLLLVLTLVLAVGMAAVVWAEAPKAMPGAPAQTEMTPGGPHPMGMMRGCRHKMMNLTPEQAGKLFDVKEKFRTDTAELRKQLFVKKAEMKALWKAETPDEKAIVAKVKELSALKAQMTEKKVLLRLEIRKIVPQGPMHTAMGMGEGCEGPGEMAMAPGGCGMGPGSAGE